MVLPLVLTTGQNLGENQNQRKEGKQPETEMLGIRPRMSNWNNLESPELSKSTSEWVKVPTKMYQVKLNQTEMVWP